MTAEEKMRRELAVENMYRLYKKYYPLWVEQKKQASKNPVNNKETEENSVSFYFCIFHLFAPRVII